MRFCDFFWDYKIDICKMKSGIKWSNLPLYRRVALLLTFIFGVSSIITYIFKLFLVTIVLLCMFMLVILTFIIVDSRASNQKKMLEEHHKIYSYNRMFAFENLLTKYHIQTGDRDKLLFLQEQAKKAQEKNSVLRPLRKPLKTLFTIIIPIVTYLATVITKSASTEEIIVIALQVIVIIICITAIVLALYSPFNDLIDRDYKRYDDLIYDIDQIILFGAPKKQVINNKAI